MARLDLGRLLTTRPDAQGSSALAHWGPFAATCVIVFLGAWLATSWFWHFFDKPRTEAVAPTRSQPTMPVGVIGEQIAAAQLFGSSGPVRAAETVSNLNVKLKGVFAATAKDGGAAIVNTGSKDEYVGAGRELLPGVTLEQIHPTHVLIRRGAQLERVNLEERVSAGGGGGRPNFAPPPRPIAPPPQIPQPQMQPPPGVNAPPPNVPPPMAQPPNIGGG